MWERDCRERTRNVAAPSPRVSEALQVSGVIRNLNSSKAKNLITGLKNEQKTLIDIFQKKTYKWLTGTSNMPGITNHQEKAHQNHEEIPHSR